MLKQLHVKNLAVIREEEVNFGEGLNILTGETGAGKSILLGSLELILKGRTDRALIRSGEESALAELTFQTDDAAIIAALKEEEIEPDADGCLVLTRKITGERSVSRINGETVSMQLMARVASLLFDIHGQQDSVLLRKSSMQAELLDAYAGEAVRAKKDAVRALVRGYREKKRERESLILDEEARSRALALAEHALSEIDGACLKSGEDEELETLYQKLSNRKRIEEAAGGAHALLGNEGGALDSLGEALKELDRALSFDPDLEGTISGIRDAESILQEAERDLGRYLDHFSFSEESFAETEERLNVLNRLKDKYGATIEDVLAFAEEKRAEVEKLLHTEENARRLRAEEDALFAQLTAEANALSDLRREASLRFSEEVRTALLSLNFPSVTFSADVEDKEEIDESGKDRICYRISLNPGEPVKPLKDVASGGELSRIMLALRSVLAGKDDIPTIIFDEIDAGISGRTAQKVAEQLLYISRSRQVICITHLAQIAAMADHHFIIEKTVEADRANTTVREADEEESVEELARILGGREITPAVLRSAREMKRLGDMSI